MPISVDWPTGVILVPLVDLVPLGGNRYTWSVLQFHLDLRDIHAMEAGGVYPKTHIHNVDVELAGVTYADSVKILPPYTVEFENGMYQVVITGANHNVSDVQVVNSVGLITQNSAGLIIVTSGAVIAPSSQVIRDAMKLAATGGSPAAGSVDEKLDTLSTDIATLDTAVDAIATAIAAGTLTAAQEAQLLDLYTRMGLNDADAFTHSPTQQRSATGGIIIDVDTPAPGEKRQTRQ